MADALDADGVSPEPHALSPLVAKLDAPHKLSQRAKVRALQLYAANGESIWCDFQALLDVLDEYQAETEKRLAALEKPRG